MKTIFLILLVVSFTRIVNAQKVVDSKELPAYQFMLSQPKSIYDWKFNKDTSCIDFYYIIHHRLNLLITNPATIAESKKKFEGKTGLGRFLGSREASGIRFDGPQQVDMFLKRSLSLKDFSEIGKKQELFHYLGDILNKEERKGDSVYMLPSDGIFELNARFVEGDVLKHPIEDLPSVFPEISLPTAILKKEYQVQLLGEGMLGLKNLKPKVATLEIKTGAEIIEPRIIVFDISTISDFQDYWIVDKSYRVSDKFPFAWFSNKEASKYKFFTYNITGKNYTITDCNFETSRNIETLNKEVYDENFNTIGYVTIFGYDKQKKNMPEVYHKTEFNLVYFNTEGKLLKKITFKHGTDDNYWIKPVVIIQKNDGKLDFLNSLSYLTDEHFTLDDQGNVEVKSQVENFGKNEEGKIKARYLMENNIAAEKVGNNYLFVTKQVENVPVKPDPNAMPGQPQTRSRDKGLTYYVTNDEFKLLSSLIVPTVATEETNIIRSLIEKKDGKYTELVNHGRYNYLVQIDKAGTLSKSDIESPFDIKKTGQLTNYLQCQTITLVDKKNRTFLLLYPIVSTLSRSEEINKFVIARVAY